MCAGSAGRSKSEARVTPNPVASRSSTTAVGLVSPRSMSEIMDRLTPLLTASALERQTLCVAQAADAGGDSLVQVRRNFFHNGCIIQYVGCCGKWTLPPQ